MAVPNEHPDPLRVRIPGFAVLVESYSPLSIDELIDELDNIDLEKKRLTLESVPASSSDTAHECEHIPDGHRRRRRSNAARRKEPP